MRIRNGTIGYVRRVYDDQFEQEVSFREGQREIATMRIEALEAREIPEPGPLEVWSISSEIPAAFVRTHTLELLPPRAETVDIAYARRIIGAGAGCSDVRPLMDGACPAS